MKKERNYGIDLLRLVLMYMVCMLHTLGQGGILNACQTGGIKYNVFWLLEILSYCAVDGFAIISGYMAVDAPRRFEKIVNMWFQVFFYSFVVTLLFTLAGVNQVWTAADIIKCAMPVTFNRFWYFTAFFVLFFVSPAFNKFIFMIDQQTARIAFMILIGLFSFVEVLTGAFQTQEGYSAIWLMVLYCIGGLAKRGRIFEQKHTITLVILWGGCILITWMVNIYLHIGLLISYVSPTILASGLIMVILFSRLKLKGTIISKLSPLAFGVYLFQLNQVIWNEYLKDAFRFVEQENLLPGIAQTFGFAALIFISGLLVELIRARIARAIKIPELSRRIVILIEYILRRLAVILR